MANKPKPTVVKLLEGNRGRRKLNPKEPRPPAGIPDCPEILDADARAEWFRIIPVLRDMGLLTMAEQAALRLYCMAYGRWHRAVEHMAQHGEVYVNSRGDLVKSPYCLIAHEAHEEQRRLLVEFGLTPSSRAKLQMPDAEVATDFEKFVGDVG